MSYIFVYHYITLYDTKPYYITYIISFNVCLRLVIREGFRQGLAMRVPLINATFCAKHNDGIF